MRHNRDMAWLTRLALTVAVPVLTLSLATNDSAHAIQRIEPAATRPVDTIRVGMSVGTYGVALEASTLRTANTVSLDQGCPMILHVLMRGGILTTSVRDSKEMTIYDHL